MILGIVGNESAKFTVQTAALAREAIRAAIRKYKPTLVVSGKCPLGGIDIWAIQEAKKLGIPWKEYPPKTNSWADGYKPRNLQIAASDVVVNIVVRELPKGYKGMTFKGCYHCGDKNPPHVKSGGCWTAWRAKKREWVII